VTFWLNFSLRRRAYEGPIRSPWGCWTVRSVVLAFNYFQELKNKVDAGVVHPGIVYGSLVDAYIKIHDTICDTVDPGLPRA
jgi:hypothetical protein